MDVEGRTANRRRRLWRSCWKTEKKKVSVKAVDALIPIRFSLLGSSARSLLI